MTAVQLALGIDLADHTDCGQSCRIATPEPRPRRNDWLMPGTSTWARIGNAGHRCDACGHSCASVAHHGKCCGEADNHVRPGVCTGHPCRPCHGSDRPVASRFRYMDGRVWWRGHGARMQLWLHQQRDGRRR